MTATMRAVLLRAAGGPEQLVCERVAVPAPGNGEALVRVHAAAITRDELEWPVDRLPAIPSYEVSGVVDALGPGVDAVDAGDEVYGMTPFDRDGVAAEYAAIAADLLAPKPRTLSHAEAAAVPLAALSAWQGLFDHGRLREDERVLIHGATGGVGQFATPLAHSHGAYVTATASTRDVERARELGADIVVDHTAGKWDADLERVDLVFDTAGGQRLAGSPGVLRDGGRLVSVADEPPHAPGITSVYFVVAPDRRQLVRIAELLDGGLPAPPSTPCTRSRTPGAPSSAACSPTSAARSCSTPVPAANPTTLPRQGLPTMEPHHRPDTPRRSEMLKSGRVATRLPAHDLTRARAFYADKLGLEPVEEREGGLRYVCATGEFALFESAGTASGDHTQMGWEVDDIEATVRELRARGVVFEEYDLPGLKTVGGIADIEGNYPSKGSSERGAWFRDSEGNMLGIGQPVRDKG